MLEIGFAFSAAFCSSVSSSFSSFSSCFISSTFSGSEVLFVIGSATALGFSLVSISSGVAGSSPGCVD